MDLSAVGQFFEQAQRSGFVTVLNVALLIHAVVTRQSGLWIAFLAVGAFLQWILTPLFYVFGVLLPNVSFYKTKEVAQQTVREGLEVIKPIETRIQEAKQKVEDSDTLHNRATLANLLSRAGKVAEAQEALQPLLKGIYADDVVVLLSSAELDMAQDQPHKAEEKLSQVDLKLSAGVRTHALTLLALAQAAQNKPVAEETFHFAIKNATTEEPRVRFAEYLLNEGRDEEARAYLSELARIEQEAGDIYLKQEREWFALGHELRKRVRVK